VSLGFDRETQLVSLSDSADLVAYLFDGDDNAVTDDVAAVKFTIQKPDNTKETLDGQVQDDGGGFLRYMDTDQTGKYPTICQFTLLDGSVRSVTANFEVFDPFNLPTPSNTEVVSSLAWDKFEDCFDAEEEGPWLRDMTLNYFNEHKMTGFIGEGLFDINVRNPASTLDINYFFIAPGDPSTDMPLLAQATMLQVIRHLMRSYTEQPDLAGTPVGYENRRDYLQRWQMVYTIEEKTYKEWVILFKRRFLGLGKSAMLVDTKAGRLLPAPLRVRTTGRGYY
jgi:hypothetical protein